MDYPPPVVHLNNNGEIDLSDAYTNRIGDWDKVTIAYGYSDFAPGTNEITALNKIIADAANNGLTFISDRDARDPSGMHPGAHLWDVGKDPVSGLNEVVKVRQKALSQFGLNTGIAFQLIDDLMGVAGDPKLTGKAVGNDIREGKKTYPILLAIKSAGRNDKSKIMKVYGYKNSSEADLQNAVNIICSLGIGSEVRAIARAHMGKALESLSCYPDSDAKRALESSARFIVERSL